MDDPLEADRIRRAGRTALAAALQDARRRTLAAFDAWERALGPDAVVPYATELNPPRWELGHVGWFQDWWLSRFPAHERARGPQADPDAPRARPRLAQADAWFDSGRVPHTDRWRLPLPSAAALREDLARGIEENLALLAATDETDDALYAFRLALFHEDMHAEAAIYMAQRQGIAFDGMAPRQQPAAPPLAMEGGQHVLGWRDAGFAFDNELAPQAVELAPYQIDATPVTWARYLPFVEAGGYTRRAHWSDEGWAWRESLALDAPRDVRRHGSTWQRRAFDRWIELDPALLAMNLSAHEAEAWCAWAGRRLPTEAEWEHAATTAGSAFTWGDVWEWTASAFAPYPGFVAHPYRDYSQPWFHTRRTLRGGSFATHPRMKHPRYRNFFPPARHDVFAGFRTCAPSPP